MKNINFMSVVLKGFANLIFAEILCLFINITLAVYGTMIIKVIAIICTSVIFIGLICNYAYNTAKKDLVIQRKMKSDLPVYRSYLIGIFLSIPYILFWGILLISKMDIIDNFYGVYKIINGQFLQLYNLMYNSAEISGVTGIEMLIMLLLTAIPFISFVIAYKLTFNGVDIDKLKYEK